MKYKSCVIRPSARRARAPDNGGTRHGQGTQSIPGHRLRQDRSSCRFSQGVKYRPGCRGRRGPPRLRMLPGQVRPTLPPSAASDFSRPAGLDLPSLADSVRSVEERIARQNADYEALNRLYEKARDAQLAAGTRADTLASELAAAQSALAVEQHRVREMERVLSESRAATGCQPRPRGGGAARHGARTRARRAPCARRWRRATRPSRKRCIRSASAMRQL